MNFALGLFGEGLPKQDGWSQEMRRYTDLQWPAVCADVVCVDKTFWQCSTGLFVICFNLLYVL